MLYEHNTLSRQHMCRSEDTGTSHRPISAMLRTYVLTTVIIGCYNFFCLIVKISGLCSVEEVTEEKN